MMEQGKNLDIFLDKVCAEVRAKGIHCEIREELSGHYEDLMTERQQLGASEEEAQQYAIAQLGDPRAIGRDLHRIHKPRIPWGLLTAVLLLSAVSLLGMGSIEAGASYKTNLRDLLLHQTVYIAIGLLVMTGMYFINFKLLQKASGIIYGGTVLAIVISVLMGMKMLNGSRRYVGFLGCNFDLISYTPYLFVVALAGLWTAGHRSLNWSGRTKEMLDVLLLVLPAVIFYTIRAFPEMAVYLTVSLILYVWITRRWVKGTLVGAAFVSGLALYVWNSWYQWDPDCRSGQL